MTSDNEADDRQPRCSYDPSLLVAAKTTGDILTEEKWHDI